MSWAEGAKQAWLSGEGMTNGLNNGYWNPIDFLLPGFSILSHATDLTGSSAAQQQYQNQMSLNQWSAQQNAAEAEKQRQWEEYMSSSQYQRTVADLKAAGLNPYLALGAMSPGGTPSGASASTSSGNADMANNKIAQAAGILAIVLRVLLTKH